MPCHPLERLLFPPVGFLRCPTCGGAHKNAVRSSRCRHAYGMKCILEHLVKHEVCPVCQAPLDASNLEPAEDLRAQVEALKIRCPEPRCTWVGPTNAVDDHVNGPECAVELVACPFCRGSFEVGSVFESHKDVCEEGIVICQQCLDDMPRKDMRKHLPTCIGNVPEPLQRQQSNLRHQKSVSPVRLSQSIHRDVSAMSPEVLLEQSFPKAGSAGVSPAAAESPPMRSMECSLISEPKPQPGDPATAAPSRATSAASAEHAARSSSSARSQHDATGTACGFEAIGCDGSLHRGMACLDPSAMHLHLTLLAARLTDVMAANAALQASHADLKATVEGQAKTIAHLTSRNNLLASYTKSRAGAPPTSGATRTNSSDKPQPVEEIVKTPVSKKAGPAEGLGSSSVRKAAGKDESSRSASSPAAPGRAAKGPAGANSAVPFFMPKQPKKPVACGPPSRRSSESSSSAATPVA